MTTADLRRAVSDALSSVDDPEYPGISIVALGLVETVSVGEDGQVDIGLIPTFSGCPALSVIAADVAAAVESVAGVSSVAVRWLAGPAWTPERITEGGRSALAGSFTVAVQLGSEPPSCPRCGGPTEERSMFGPSRCRSVNRCRACAEAVEVIRA